MAQEPEFIEKPEIEQLMPAAKRMAQYIHDNGFDVVVVGGTSATTAAYMVKIWWQTLFPKQKMPDFLAGLNDTRKSEPFPIKRSNTISASAADLLKERYPGELYPGRNVFVLEEYSRKGESLRKIKKSLQKTGIRKIKTGTLVADKFIKSWARLDFIGVLSNDEGEIYGLRRDLLNKALLARKFPHRQDTKELKQASIEGLRRLRSRIRACVR